MQSLWYLYNIGLITQPDKVLNIKNSKIKQANELRILDEQDFKQATDFIKHLIQNKTEGCIIHLPIEMEKIPTEDLLIEYSIPKLRMDHVMGKQKLFQLYMPEQNDMQTISVFTTKVEYFKEVIELLENYFEELNIERLKFHLANNQQDRKLLNTLLDLDFEKEAVLSAEAITGDLIVASKKLR